MGRRSVPGILIILSMVSLAPERGAAQRSGAQIYNEGIQLLYQQNQPEQAVELFEQANRLEPNDWTRPFMVGYTRFRYLNQPDQALPFFDLAVQRNSALEEIAFRERIQCLERLDRFEQALAANREAQAAYRRNGRDPGPWFQENAAYLHWQLGDPDAARQLAPPGSWVAEQVAPKSIRIDWNLNFARLLREWRLDTQRSIRITLPIDRPYQKLISVRISAPRGSPIRQQRRSSRGNNFLQLTRSGAWPETLRLQLVVRQEARTMAPRRPHDFRPVDANDPNFAWASENKDGLFSLEDPRFTERMRRITANAQTTGEQVEQSLDWLRANFRYGDKPSGGVIEDWIQHGSGDCGYYTYIAIAMLRHFRVPVRGLYGIGPWNDPTPALPHSIVEIYDAGSGQWIPHDPQVRNSMGVINPAYVAFTAANPKQDAGAPAADGVWEIDSVWFFWTGSGRETLSFTVQTEGSQIATRSVAPTPLAPPGAPANRPAINDQPFAPEPRMDGGRPPADPRPNRNPSAP